MLQKLSAFLLLTTPLVLAQQPGALAPMPSQIASARRIFISNAPWDDYCHVYSGGPNRGYNSFYGTLQQSHRYQIVTAPTEADLVFEMSCKAPSTEISVSSGQTGTNYKPHLLLRILDPKTNIVLWTLTSKIPPGVLAKNRDKQFDKAVVDLVGQLKQLSGGQHTPVKNQLIPQHDAVLTRR